MDIKTIPPRSVLSYSTETSLAELDSYVGRIAASMYRAAADSSLLPSGPVTWVYHGADGKPDTRFILEIILPVQGKPAGELNFAYKEQPAFHCVSTIHYGNWENLPATYRQIMSGLHQQGKKLTGVIREEYVYFDFEYPVNNITEVQIGI